MDKKSIKAGSIPQYMKDRSQWLMWRLEERPNGKYTKVPYKPTSLQTLQDYAKSNDPATWSDFETCSQAFEKGGFSGIGYVFAIGDGLFGIDLDHCFTSDGELKPWAQEFVDKFSVTYIEKSPSGEGLHIVGFGKPIKTGEKKWNEPGTEIEQGIEIYEYSRYFTFTGDALTSNDLAGCQPGLEWLYQKYFAEHHQEPTEARTVEGHADEALVLGTLDVIPADNYKTWLDVGMALKAAGFVLEIWDEWSKKSAKYQPGECGKKWDSFASEGIGLGTLFHYAKEHGFRFPKSQPTGQSTSLQTTTATDLMSMQFAQQRWAIEPILPEGLTIIAGPPKVGKSWMAYSLACSVAVGADALGGFTASKGKVLYLALEDNRRRLQERLKKLSEQDVTLISANLELCTSINRLDEGGLGELRQWLDANPDCRLVIIDTLSRFSAEPNGKRNAYDNDYRGLAPLQKLAIEKQVALVLITHLRKQGVNDPLAAVMGSTGITGVADAIWLLKRGRAENEGTLAITGRDVEDLELAVEFDKETCHWKSLGDAKLHQLSEQRRKIIEVLEQSDKPLGPKEVAEALGKPETNIRTMMKKMHEQGQIEKKDRGEYIAIKQDRSLRSLLPHSTQKPLTA